MKSCSGRFVRIFKKIPSSTCPFVDLPEKRAGHYGQGSDRLRNEALPLDRADIVCQIKFREWTRDHRLRQPVFLGLREDKDAKEVVREKAS